MRCSAQLMLVAWLLIWIATLPLFHIHLDREHNKGLPHTVMTPSLPGEFSGALWAMHTASCPSAAFGEWQFSYPELQLALSSLKEDPNKRVKIHVELLSQLATDDIYSSGVRFDSEERLISRLPLDASPPGRGPPISTSSVHI